MGKKTPVCCKEEHGRVEQRPSTERRAYDGNVPPVTERLAAWRQDAVDDFTMLDS